MEIQYNDINTKTLSLTGDSSHIIQGQSVVLFSITGEEEAERFQVTLDGKTKTSRLPYFVFGEVTGAGASASVKVIRKD